MFKVHEGKSLRIGNGTLTIHRARSGRAEFDYVLDSEHLPAPAHEQAPPAPAIPRRASAPEVRKGVA